MHLRLLIYAVPHAPFIYDINGGTVDKEHSMDWTDSKYFLEQYEYICKRNNTSDEWSY